MALMACSFLWLWHAVDKITRGSVKKCELAHISKNPDGPELRCEILDSRALPFDRLAAATAAVIAARQRQIGRLIEIRDVQIAGIAAARKATLATRNTRHFADLGITLVDPWHS